MSKRAIGLRARAKQQRGLPLSQSERINLKWINKYMRRNPHMVSTIKRLTKDAVQRIVHAGSTVGGRTVGGERIKAKPTKISKQEQARSKSFTHAEQIRRYGRVITETQKPLSKQQSSRARSLTEEAQRKEYGRVVYERKPGLSYYPGAYTRIGKRAERKFAGAISLIKAQEYAQQFKPLKQADVSVYYKPSRRLDQPTRMTYRAGSDLKRPDWIKAKTIPQTKAGQLKDVLLGKEMFKKQGIIPFVYGDDTQSRGVRKTDVFDNGINDSHLVLEKKEEKGFTKRAKEQIKEYGGLFSYSKESGKHFFDIPISLIKGTGKLLYGPNIGGGEPAIDIGQGKYFKSEGKLYEDPDVQTLGMGAAFVGIAASSPLIGFGLGVGFVGYQGYQTFKEPSPENLGKLTFMAGIPLLGKGVQSFRAKASSIDYQFKGSTYKPPKAEVKQTKTVGREVSRIEEGIKIEYPRVQLKEKTVGGDTAISVGTGKVKYLGEESQITQVIMGRRATGIIKTPKYDIRFKKQSAKESKIISARSNIKIKEGGRLIELKYFKRGTDKLVKKRIIKDSPDDLPFKPIIEPKIVTKKTTEKFPKIKEGTEVAIGKQKFFLKTAELPGDYLGLYQPKTGKMFYDPINIKKYTRFRYKKELKETALHEIGHKLDIEQNILGKLKVPTKEGKILKEYGKREFLPPDYLKKDIKGEIKAEIIRGKLQQAPFKKLPETKAQLKPIFKLKGLEAKPIFKTITTKQEPILTYDIYPKAPSKTTKLFGKETKGVDITSAEKIRTIDVKKQIVGKEKGFKGLRDVDKSLVIKTQSILTQRDTATPLVQIKKVGKKEPLILLKEAEIEYALQPKYKPHITKQTVEGYKELTPIKKLTRQPTLTTYSVLKTGAEFGYVFKESRIKPAKGLALSTFETLKSMGKRGEVALIKPLIEIGKAKVQAEIPKVKPYAPKIKEYALSGSEVKNILGQKKSPLSPAVISISKPKYKEEIKSIQKTDIISKTKQELPSKIDIISKVEQIPKTLAKTKTKAETKTLTRTKILTKTKAETLTKTRTKTMTKILTPTIPAIPPIKTPLPPIIPPPLLLFKTKKRKETHLPAPIEFSQRRRRIDVDPLSDLLSVNITEIFTRGKRATHPSRTPKEKALFDFGVKRGRQIFQTMEMRKGKVPNLLSIFGPTKRKDKK